MNNIQSPSFAKQNKRGKALVFFSRILQQLLWHKCLEELQVFGDHVITYVL